MEVNTNTTNQPPTTGDPALPAPIHKDKKTTIVTAAVIVLIVLVLGLIAWALAQNSKNSSKFTYSSLNSYTLPGFYKKAGMSFEKPVQVLAANELPDSKDYMVLVHDKTLTTNNKIITISYMGAYSAYNTMGTQRDQATITAINNALTVSTSPGYQEYRTSLSQFASRVINTRYKLTLGATHAITTPNIKSAAWATDFTGVDNSPISKYTPTKVQGEEILAVGKNAYYYLVIGSVGNNWNNNQSVWQQVVNSIKIDQ